MAHFQEGPPYNRVKIHFQILEGRAQAAQLKAEVKARRDARLLRVAAVEKARRNARLYSRVAVGLVTLLFADFAALLMSPFNQALMWLLWVLLIVFFTVSALVIVAAMLRLGKLLTRRLVRAVEMSKHPVVRTIGGPLDLWDPWLDTI